MALYTMKELLADAQVKRYGIGFFNTHNQEMLRACITAAEELNSPIIVGTAEALLQYSDFDMISPMMLEAARNAKVPVAVHLDHTYNFDNIMRALRSGFGSVMYDGSRSTYEENVRVSADIARVAHPMGAGLECELGCVGGLADGDNQVDENVYTDPDMASSFVELTGADFLAVSIGTVHGVYKSTPKLDLNRLAAIRNRVEAPLVLHGGSGLSDDDFRATIVGGICKINVYTDIILAGKKAIADNMDKGYSDIFKASEAAMCEAVKTKLTVFGSAGKA
jgi:fructose-bisphosphate aldolase class II